MVPLSRPIVQQLLSVMDRKHHWAWPSFTKPGLSRAQLLTHFQNEYGTYVRDFPTLLARVLGHVPDLLDVRIALAANIYEEQTGGLSNAAPHPELFLQMMVGLGFSREDFTESALETRLTPAAKSYRDWLRTRANSTPWQAAAAILTIFVEGSVNERRELTGEYVRPKGADAIARHPLVVHYGCPPDAMRLVRAHSDIEGSHRTDAWAILLNHAADDMESQIVESCSEALTRWLAYRDSIAAQMGLRNEG